MSRKLAVVVTCDLCDAVTGEHGADIIVFTWQGKTYELDGCAGCNPTEYSIAALIEVARPWKDPALCCPECDYCAATPTRLESHKTKKHPDV